jgi:hypothetical protein
MPTSTMRGRTPASTDPASFVFEPSVAAVSAPAASAVGESLGTASVPVQAEMVMPARVMLAAIVTMIRIVASLAHAAERALSTQRFA